MLAELKQCFMEAYDDNQDGKIDIREVNKADDLYQLINWFNLQCLLLPCTVYMMTCSSSLFDSLDLLFLSFDTTHKLP